MSIPVASVHNISLDNTDPSVANMKLKIQYNSITSALRHCARTCTRTRHDDGTSLNSNYPNGRIGDGRRRHGRGNSLPSERTAAKSATLQAKYPCNLCKKKDLTR